MKLIDAEEFKRQIAGMAIVSDYPPRKANALCELIDKQPTAYDVDKVVKKLEERKSLYKRLQKLKGRDFIGYGYKEEAVYSICRKTLLDMRIEAIDDAIEIVKENINHE